MKEKIAASNNSQAAPGSVSATLLATGTAVQEVQQKKLANTYHRLRISEVHRSIEPSVQAITTSELIL
ncbi:hypothetical protein [Nostoc sp.]|uniref:hypothetical protein n=1 Tax=Nostoc sp. TaxID=1180 RepID=UPI002FF2148E